MDAFRFHSLVKHWADHPPVHITVAAYVYGGGRRSTPAEPQALPAAHAPGAVLDSLMKG